MNVTLLFVAFTSIRSYKTMQLDLHQYSANSRRYSKQVSK